MKKLSAFSMLLGSYLTAALPTFAAVGDPIQIDLCPKADPTKGNTNLSALCRLQFDGATITKIITIAFVIATILALAFLIFGGIRWIISGGEKEKVEEARKAIVAALVGLVLVFLSYFILRLVFTVIGIEFGTGFQIPSLIQK